MLLVQVRAVCASVAKVRLCTKPAVFNRNLNCPAFNLLKSQISRSDVFSTSSTVWNQTPPNQQSKALVLLSDLKELRSSPRPALALGLGGLIPFVIPPLYFLSMQQISDFLVNSQLVYGAVSLSYLGGIQWGYAISEASQGLVKINWRSLGHSVLPSLIAWTSLLLPVDGTTLCLIGGHSYTLYRDMSLAIYPPWFRALRFILSLVAIVALWTTFICTFAFTKTDTESAQKMAT